MLHPDESSEKKKRVLFLLWVIYFQNNREKLFDRLLPYVGNKKKRGHLLAQYFSSVTFYSFSYDLSKYRFFLYML